MLSCMVQLMNKFTHMFLQVLVERQANRLPSTWIWFATFTFALKRVDYVNSKADCFLFTGVHNFSYNVSHLCSYDKN